MAEFIEVEIETCEPFIKVGARVKSCGREMIVTEVNAPFFTAEDEKVTRLFAWGERGVGTIGVERPDSRSVNENDGCSHIYDFDAAGVPRCTKCGELKP